MLDRPLLSGLPFCQLSASESYPCGTTCAAVSAEADRIEMTLPRRRVDVYRDERDFGAGRGLATRGTRQYRMLERVHRRMVRGVRLQVL